ncbi:MAG: DUF4159 domain-containing protein [Kiritimatiellia bacterium]
MKQMFRKTAPQLRRVMRTVLLAGVVSLCLTGGAIRADEASSNRAPAAVNAQALVSDATNMFHWPDGMKDMRVRFIRMEYDGAGWDDGMDAVSRADLNFLDAFHALTGFKVATKSEGHKISLLRKYPRGFAPPFVYMTGTSNINVSASDVKIMREYLISGGLLFASAGSPQWGPSFKSFIAQVFPGQGLLVIADDDPLFQVPFTFPNGAPLFWHYSGTRVLGIKHNGRWAVYFHPGGIHDAWKTGHSGMDPVLAEDATRIGINVIYYAFTHYLEKTRGYR